MIDLKQLQKEVYANKVKKGFNTTDIAQEFCRAYEELSEAFKKYNQDEEGVAEEVADVAIFLLGISEIMGFDLEDEITKKVQKNKERKYDSFMNKEGQKIFVRVKTEGDE
ncbi:MAG: NTP pyrophosphatase (non-canonical NTP hydrolase) [Candidatus Paceibacteria bacterium]|jgi:NTP pyrophosphatase (non-canonical NTP hydrolase)